ncbi:MAG: OmpA family protein [Bacteroidetes bacterium]|nr:MAG: OmpA family protein [Bacteroidota bacterium]
MRMVRIKVIVIILFYLLLKLPLISQNMGDFREIIPLPSKDTLVINRGLGDWWFGANVGYSGNYYFGKLKLPLTEHVYEATIPFPDSLINFPSGSGSGYMAGIFGEWNPKGSDWGASLSLQLIDFRRGSAVTDPSEDSTHEEYEAITDFNYISVSPSARYNFSAPGFYALGGLDFDYCISSKLVNKLKFQNTGNIDQERRNLMTNTKIRIGFHFGIAYEFLVADINHKFRLLFSPYITLNGGTNVMSNFNSSRNQLYAKIGLFIKLGPDEVTKDTLMFDANYKPPPDAYATSRRENGPFFGGVDEVLLAYEAKPVERSQVSEEVAEKSTIDVVEKVNTTTEPQRKITIRAGQRKTYFFPSSASTSLTGDAREYLDNVAEYLKANPSSTVRIVGHSDDQGTFSQNQKRSEDRANQVVQYLVSRGISKGRLFPRGDGARVPVGDNRNEEGRKRNRRVEIMIVQ